MLSTGQGSSEKGLNERVYPIHFLLRDANYTDYKINQTIDHERCVVHFLYVICIMKEGRSRMIDTTFPEGFFCFSPKDS